VGDDEAPDTSDACLKPFFITPTSRNEPMITQ
jgi:hypothetical protein